jgi:hypothetical protein
MALLAALAVLLHLLSCLLAAAASGLKQAI